MGQSGRGRGKPAVAANGQTVGQIVGYVRDLNGGMVELCSDMTAIT